MNRPSSLRGFALIVSTLRPDTGPDTGHPIVFLSSGNFVTRIHRAFCQPFGKTLVIEPASLPLCSNSAPKRYKYPAYVISVAQHPLSRLQQFSERGPGNCPVRGPNGLHAVDRGPLSPTEPIVLRTGSAVAQRDIFHAEGSFRSCALKNDFHRSPIINAPPRVGP